MTELSQVSSQEREGPLRSIHAVSLYTPELEWATAHYQALGLELLWRSEERNPSGVSFTQVGLRFPQGEAKLFLHDNPDKQFMNFIVAVDDVCSTYRQLTRKADYIWLELPHNTKLGCMALVRVLDGNVFTLLGPTSECKCSTAGLLRK